MKIRFLLAWSKSSKSLSQCFKEEAAAQLFANYLKRLGPWCDVSWVSGFQVGAYKRPVSTRLWICERQKIGAKNFSSEQLADRVNTIMDLGVQHLDIVIGGSDGFQEEEIHALRPDLLWSFGALTLPHELAAVVASEQIYRALCIIKKHPYHSGHTHKD